MQSTDDYPHGLSDRKLDNLLTVDLPVNFNFHGYTWRISRVAYL